MHLPVVRRRNSSKKSFAWRSTSRSAARRASPASRARGATPATPVPLVRTGPNAAYMAAQADPVFGPDIGTTGVVSLDLPAGGYASTARRW
jgi:hypothetical protein